jgi:glycosyltransferase involved in cell wall biosynthesis
MNKKISIIIPIYNEEKYIAKCLDSIIKSDFDKDKIEVLLVDGGSSDKTVEIIKINQ